MDSIGNFINAKVLGSSLDDNNYFVRALPEGKVMGTGTFPINDYAFATTRYYGGQDIFMSIFAPWNGPDEPTTISRLSPPPININPNPTQGTCVINTPDTGALTITDVLGRIMMNRDINNARQRDISTEGWPGGIYQVRWVSSNGTVDRCSLAKQ